MSKSRQCIEGMIVLAVVYAGIILAAGAFIGATLGFGASVAVQAGNLIFCVALAAMVYLGASSPDRFGYLIAPIVFFAVWFSASCVSRIVANLSIPANVRDLSIPSSARSERTVIADGHQQLDVLLALGLVDRAVKIDRSNGAITKITETTRRPDAICTTTDLPSSAPSPRLPTNCLVRRQLEQIPDGLVIRQLGNGLKGAGGCCSGVIGLLRRDGVESQIFAWRHGEAIVVSYTPFFGYHSPSMIWGAGGGPIKNVWYGQDAYLATTYHAGLAAYGLTSQDVMEKYSARNSRP